MITGVVEELEKLLKCLYLYKITDILIKMLQTKHPKTIAARKYKTGWSINNNKQIYRDNVLQKG